MSQSHLFSKEKHIMNNHLLKEIIKPPKTYSHFDYPISVAKQEALIKCWMSPSAVKKHCFAPMISFNIKHKKTDGKIQTTKLRPIQLASHKDALLYRLYGYLLREKYESYLKKTNLLSVPQAYRQKHSSISATKKAFDDIASTSNAWIIKGDFSHFFDSLNHKLLLNNVRKILTGSSESKLPDDWYHVLRSLLRYRNISKHTFQKFLKDFYTQASGKSRFSFFNHQLKEGKIVLSSHNRVGVPEGTALSAVLANVYLINFDQWLLKVVTKHSGTYYRYSDDFIIILPNSNQNIVTNLTRQIIKKSNESLRLTIKPEKTKTFHYTNNQIYAKSRCSCLVWLGFSFDGSHVSANPQAIYSFRCKAKESLIKLAKVKGTWNNPTPPKISNDFWGKKAINAKQNKLNMPLRKQITKQYLTTNPIRYENVLSYAYLAQYKLTRFKDKDSPLYTVNVLKNYRHQIAKIQRFYNIQLSKAKNTY